MNINIRKSIYNNFKDSNEQEITKAINDAISENDEITLPGLGVFFELLWKQSSDDEQNNIINKIKGAITK